MVIQLPKETEDQLQELADRVGTPAVDPAVDAINTMLTERRKADRWPPPKTVGIVERSESDADNLDEAMTVRSQPWPRSVGMLQDGGVKATEFEDWLADNWTRD